jgi:hypothetical protein
VDLDPAFQVNTDPDDPGFSWPKIEKIGTAEKNYLFSFVDQKLQFTHP